MPGSVVSPSSHARLRELRRRRNGVRRAVEVARLQSPPGAPVDGLAEAERELARLTEELITLYRSDLGLVDSLLDPAYPANVEGRGTP